MADFSVNLLEKKDTVEGQAIRSHERYLLYKEGSLSVCLFAMRSHTVQPISMKLS